MRSSNDWRQTSESDSEYEDRISGLPWEDYHGKTGKPNTEEAVEMMRVYGEAISQGASPVQGLAALRDYMDNSLHRGSRHHPSGWRSYAEAAYMKDRWYEWILHLERKLDPDRMKRLRGRERGPDGK